jgi:pimeloyl-ACP methyl ester carboxylesterase
MPIASINSIEIAYETFGEPKDPTLVLIMGLGEQMVAWPKKFCQMLAKKGIFVIRFDNRDTGFSTKLDSCGVPDVMGAWEDYFRGKPIGSPYMLKDMAADVNGLLDSLSIEKALICGFSLGGMVAQNMAFTFPDRMMGMICMGSSTGERTLPSPSPEARSAMLGPPPPSRDGFVGHNISVYRAFSGGSTLYDPKCRTETAAFSFDRGLHPEGFVRQSVAMLADGDRTDRLKRVQLPTLVLHGELDPLAPPAHGRAIADAVSGAQFVVLANWGHGIDYPALWPSLTEHIINFQKAHPV